MDEQSRQTSEYERALLAPDAVYSRPAQVLADERLDDEQKLRILRRWETDCRELQVAEEEGMTDGGNGADVFTEVLQAIRTLASRDQDTVRLRAPTKHGGSY